MATRKPPPPPQQANLTPDKMRKGVTRLERLIAEIEAFDVDKLTKRWSAEQIALETTIEGTLASVFGHGTVEYRRYHTGNLDHGGIVMDLGFGGGSRNDDGRLARQYVTEGKAQAIQTLQSAVKWLHEEIEHTDELPPSTADVPLLKLSQKIFIVHGHDQAALQTVARLIERIGYEAIILSEQANRGRTIIEKIEEHGDVGFAVVLLTPDDVGGKSSESLQPRARQNVLLELGYFIARLNRERVFTLAKGDLEMPTDFAGVVWQSLDDAGAWKQALARELQAAGYPIDWNKVMS